MQFDYVEFLGFSEERIFRPLIPVTFKHKGLSFKSFALLDSGADYTILPIQVADSLGVALASDLSFQIEGAGGQKFTIYKSPETVDHVLSKRGFRDIKWSCPVYFSESGSTLLLGQKGFLDRFKVTLDGHSRTASIVSPRR